MQNLLTQILEVYVIFHIVLLTFSFGLQAYTKLNAPKVEAELETAQIFDSGIKAIMATEAEPVQESTVQESTVQEPVITVKATKHKVNSDLAPNM